MEDRDDFVDAILATALALPGKRGEKIWTPRIKLDVKNLFMRVKFIILSLEIVSRI
jgi:hypothetical protein